LAGLFQIDLSEVSSFSGCAIKGSFVLPSSKNESCFHSKKEEGGRDFRKKQIVREHIGATRRCMDGIAPLRGWRSEKGKKIGKEKGCGRGKRREKIQQMLIPQEQERRPHESPLEHSIKKEGGGGGGRERSEKGDQRRRSKENGLWTKRVRA